MKIWKYIFGFLFLVSTGVWLAVIGYPEKNLQLIACDVGQGDAILAQYGETQILIDGGPGNKVLDCLSSHLPFWDREIEVVVLTHPETDHFGGLIEVFKRYKVGLLLTNGVERETKEYQVFKEAVKENGTEIVNSFTGTQIRVDKVYLDIIWPEKDLVAKNNNDHSLVIILSLGEFDALLTGDIGPKITEKVLQTGKIRDIEYLKVPHHGSKNGLTKDLLDISQPEIAVISVGKNQWGHPHDEVLEMLREKDINILRTDQSGNVGVVTGGGSWRIEEKR